ncbi:MAG: SurA N-terminal domain-containing protein [Alphaproteobacteria bacterium]|nr:SurA N-terminal domain-containing protein [Alphaproteobacteria bacterium]
MLKNFRDASNKPVAKILIAILMFSFVGWGAANWILDRNNVDDSIVRIGREPIKLAQFEQERSRQMAQMSREQQKAIYTERATGINFSQQILSKLASQLMLEQRAYDLGLAVSNASMANAIRAEPAFLENGKFSPIKFDYVLAMSGISESDFAEHIRRSLLREMVLSGVSAGITVPDFAVVATYNSRNARRNIEFSTVRFANFKISGNPTEEQLRDTYAKNPKIIPEFRTVSYVLVPADMSKPDLVDRAYTTAQRIEDALISGDAMQGVAAKHNVKFVTMPAISTDWKTSMGTTLNDSVLNEAARSAVWNLDQGMESEIFETKSGFVILRVEKVAPAHAAEMDSMRAELVGLWKIAEQKKQAYEKANEILISARTNEKSIGSATMVTRANGAPLEVLSAAFSLPVGTKTIVPGVDSFHIIHVINSTMPKMDKSASTALNAEVATMLSRTLNDDYSSFLSRKYPMKINNHLFKRLFGE